MPYGLVPWGTGNWGLSIPPGPTPIPPPTALIHIINVNPTPGSFNIARNQTFTFTIKTIFALNPNTTFIFLDNQIVVNGVTINPDFTVITSLNVDGISVDYSITPNYLFADRDVFTLQVSAVDIYNNQSFPFWAGYVVVDTRPPLVTPIYPLDGYTNVPLDLTIHFLINQLAAPDVGLNAPTLDIYIDDTPAVLSGVIQPAFNGDYSAINLPSNITDPFEILLDYTNSYTPNDIIVVSVTIKELITNNIRTSKYSFVTTEFENTYAVPIFAGYFQGIYLADNLGDGYHVNVTWHPARTTRPDDDIAYLIYYSTTRSDVFFEDPKLITVGRRLTSPELVRGADAQLFGYFAQIPLSVGITYYFGIRATEFPHSTIPTVPADGYGTSAVGLTVVDGYSFRIPTPQLLKTTVIGSGAVVIIVTSTIGFSTLGGYITVGSEIMRYTSLTNTTFVVASNGRGLFGSSIIQTHSAGESVKMYYGNFDDNTVIAKNLVSWETPNDPHRTRPDLITTDFSLEDGYHTGFEFFDYCGYHRFRPDELLDDQQCNTYVGGEFNGHRGLFIFDRMLANEEQLLETTGEPAILLRRLWSGETCFCRTARRDSSKVRSCSVCFGTGFKGGYVQYFNPRRDDQKIMVHFAPTDESVGMGPQSGWDQTFKPGTWTLAVPAVKDRDMIIRFNEFGEMDWIYTVNASSRAKTFFGRYARQKLQLNRIDKTDVLYQFKIIV